MLRICSSRASSSRAVMEQQGPRLPRVLQPGPRRGVAACCSSVAPPSAGAGCPACCSLATAGGSAGTGEPGRERPAPRWAASSHCMASSTAPASVCTSLPPLASGEPVSASSGRTMRPSSICFSTRRWSTLQGQWCAGQAAAHCHMPPPSRLVAASRLRPSTYFSSFLMFSANAAQALADRKPDLPPPLFCLVGIVGAVSGRLRIISRCRKAG